MKKDRPDSFEGKLQANQLEALERWLFDPLPGEGTGPAGKAPLTYDQAVERVHKDFGVRVSCSALRRFYQRKDRERLRERVFERTITAAHGANAAVEAAAENPAPFQEAILNFCARVAMEKLARGEVVTVGELADLTALALGPRREDREDKKVALKEKDHSLAERKLALLEAKEASTKKVLSDATLTVEEQNQKLRSVFGMA